MKYWTVIALVVLLVLVCMAILLPKSEHSRVYSPDGTLVAITYSRSIWSIIPIFPGQGGDKSGWIRIETKDGKKIKEYKVDMLSFIQDIYWEDGNAHLPLHESDKK